MLTQLAGYKTYITAAIGILTETGLVIDGEVTWQNAIPVVITCLLGAFIRHGVTTEAQK
jgi:hypothetical protein